MMAWTRALLSEHGPTTATAVHVALVLGTHMSGDGGTRCFPGVTLLAAESRLSHVTVSKRLDELAECGWLARWQEASGRGWRLWHYEAVFPPDLDVAEFDPPWLVDPTWQRNEGAKRRYAPQPPRREKPRCAPSVNKTGDVRNLRSRGAKPDVLTCETSGAEVRKEVSTKYPKEVSIGGIQEEGAASAAPGAKKHAGKNPKNGGAQPDRLSDEDIFRKHNTLTAIGCDLDTIVERLTSYEDVTPERIRSILAKFTRKSGATAAKEKSA